MTYAHTQGSASNSTWKYDPNVETKYQPAITSNSYGTVYGNGAYSRGHQCPNASRKSDDTMNAQTYYATNQTPQLQEQFNPGIWLEHKAYDSNDSYTNYIVSIDDIESKTGFNLFAGLPEDLEAGVEAAKTSWSEFSNF